MFNRRQTIARNQRKLPSLPPVRRQPPFWPTYRGAVNWMQNHQDCFETAVDLVEIHPKLMRNKACDKLFYLVSKMALSSRMESVANLKLNSRPAHTAVQSIPKLKLPEVPTISVSRASENEETSKEGGSVRNLFVCGMNKADKWVDLIMSLCESYFVRCNSEIGEENKDSLESVLRSDLIVFLMDDKSLSNEQCLDHLESVLRRKQKLVFIRELDFEKPSSISTSKRPMGGDKRDESDNRLREMFMDNKLSDLNQFHSQRESPMLYDPRCLDSTNHFDPRCLDNTNHLFLNDSHTSAMSVTPNILRHDSFLSVSSSFSAPELHDINRLSKNHNNNTASFGKHVDTSERTSTPTNILAFPSTVSAKIDVWGAIQDGYQNSLIYTKNHHRDVVTALKSFLNQISKTKNDLVKKEEFLATPTTCDSRETSSECSSMHEMDIIFTPEPEPKVETQAHVTNKSDPIDDLDSERPSQDTVYLIFANEREKVNTPTVFHWPSDYIHENTCISNSPSIDSFGFQDVDLSKSINDFNIASDNESDGLL